jgi:hypothetical protein
MQQRARAQVVRYDLDIAPDEIVIVLACDPLVLPPDVERVVEQFLAVCADVEDNREGSCGAGGLGLCVIHEVDSLDPCYQRVNDGLSSGDADSSRSLVSNALPTVSPARHRSRQATYQNGFSVRHNDQVNIPLPALGVYQMRLEVVLERILLRIVEKDASRRPSKDVRVRRDGLCLGRGVDDREQLGQVSRDQRVEEDLDLSALQASSPSRLTQF